MTDEEPDLTEISDLSELANLAEEAVVGVRGRDPMIYLRTVDEGLVFLGSEGVISAIEITIALEQISLVKRGSKRSPRGSLVFGHYTSKRYGPDPKTGAYMIGFVDYADPLLKSKNL